MNEFDLYREIHPLTQNHGNLLQVKTKINYFSDFEFRLNTNLSQIVRKFGHAQTKVLIELYLRYLKLTLIINNEIFF